MRDPLVEMMPAFRLELTKTAAPAMLGALRRAVGGASAGAGIGAGAGALLGAGVGGVSRYRQARREGATTGQALGSGLVGGLGGVGKGALLGMAGGALGGGLAGRTERGRELLGRALKSDSAVGSLARAGQRQVHSVSGWEPEGGVRAMRAGAYDAIERARNTEQAFRRGATGPEAGKLLKDMKSAKKGLRAAEESERMGMTSLPGYIKAVKQHGAKAVQTGLAEQWHGGDNAHRALVFGMPAFAAAQALMKKRREGDPSLLEDAGNQLGALATTGTPIPMLGSMILGGAISGAGRVAGRGLRKAHQLVGERASLPAPGPEPETGQTVPTERVYSNSALGLPPEGALA